MPDLYVLAGMCGGYFVLVYVALWARLNDVWGRLCGNIVCTRCDAHGDVCLRKKGYRQQQGPPREVSGSGEGGGRGSTEGVGLAPTHHGDALPPSSLPAPEDQQDVTISPQEDETGEEEKKGCGEEEGEQNAERAEPPAAGAAAREQAPPRRDDSSVAVLGVHTAQCTVKSSRQHRRMVLDVDKLGLWTVKSSERAVFAIMGPSGSGKSTLLNIVAGRKHNDCWGCGTLVHGKVSINGAVLSTAQRRRQIGYVTQEDAQLSVLTVTEAITFSADVRLSSYVGRTERRRRVSTAIDALGLRGVAHSRIGVAGVGGLSGGERRRVSIAVELVVDPLVLLLDEPTTGLDAASASVVMRQLDVLAKRGRVVVCTIHQPRPDIFRAFGRVLVLCGGCPAYLGTAVGAAAHFAGRGFPCPEGVNTADHVLDTLAIKDIDVGHILGNVTAEAAARDAMEQVPTPSRRTTCVPGCCFQQGYLMARSMRVVVRRSSLFLAHLLSGVGFGLLVGFVYRDVGVNIGGLQNRTGGLFVMTAFSLLTGLSAVGAWTEERAVYVRERAACYYGALPYFVAKVISDVIPLRVIPTLAFCASCYWLIGLDQPATPASVLEAARAGGDQSLCALSYEPIANTSASALANGVVESVASRFFYFAASQVLVAVASAGMCMAIGAATPSLNSGNFIGIFTMLLFLLFAGLLVNRAALQSGLQWLFTVTPLSYAYEALAASAFEGQFFLFDPKRTNGKVFVCSAITGSDWLEQFGLDWKRKAHDLGALAAIAAAYYVVAFLSLKFLVYERR